MSKLVDENSRRSQFSPKKEKICIICGKPFIGNSSNQKTCSPECSRTNDNRRQRQKQYNRPKKGYNQSGENNNVFKKSSQPRRKGWIYQKYRKDHCEYCGKQHLETKLTFVVHHRDGNPINDDPSNLITLCHSCHKLVHNGKIVLDKV